MYAIQKNIIEANKNMKDINPFILNPFHFFIKFSLYPILNLQDKLQKLEFFLLSFLKHIEHKLLLSFISNLPQFSQFLF